ncbi:MAG: glycosyltransferase family 4 protein [Bdellovibrionales bacterium]
MEQKGTLQICLSEAWGGLEMVAFEVAVKMKANGHFVTTVCPPGSPLEKNLHASGLETIPLMRKSKYFCPESIITIRRALKTGLYSAVLIEQMNELWQVVPAMWGMKDIRLVGISHTFLGISKKDFLHRILYQRMNSLIALTEIHKQNLLANLPVNPNAMEIIPNAVDTEKFNPRRRSQEFRKQYVTDELLIGVVSRLDLGKGVREVVEVGDLLKKARIPYKIIMVGTETAGEGGAKAILEKEIQLRGLQEQVLLIGHRSDIETIIASLDILLMPSPTETFGRVLIEAMASGVAIVASAGGGVPNIINNAQNGLLVPPLSSEGMAKAIASYYKDPDMRQRLASNGLICANEFYDYRKLDQKLYNILGLSN